MKGVLVHAALLLAALVIAYVTWSREAADARQREAVTVWRGRVADIDSVTYDRDGTTLTLQRRTAGDTAYLWGIRRSRAADGSVASTAFPVGEHGEELVGRLATLTALRDLGMPTDSALIDYGLVDPPGRLLVGFRDGPRELRIGASAVGGGHGYAIDPVTGRAYVLSADVVRRLSTGPSALQLTEVHDFDPSAVGSASVRAGARTIVLHRGAGRTATSGSWSREDGAADPTLTDFMESLWRLYVVAYEADVDTSALELRLRAEYHDAQGRPLGFLELYRRPSERDAGGFDYYLRTERTRIHARAIQLPAERVDDALATVLAGQPDGGPGV